MTDGHTERLGAALAGRYRIERKLGEGGMASVYLAEDLKHERKVALKILRPELAAVLGAERFLSEIKTTANLQHPHILPLFDSGEANGYLYYVMPYIDGETLREKLDREKQLGVEESVRIAKDVADALDYAHRAGVIHRDIKPGNILLHDGRPVVADFGIALAVSAAGGGRMTETGLSLGTPHYMSPEQASADRDLTPRSDVYSLGCVLYEMIAGQPPHTGPSAQSILVRILTETPRPLTDLRHTVPPHVAAAVAKAIEKLPADRFEGAKELRDALEDTTFRFSAAAGQPAATDRPALGHAGPASRPTSMLHAAVTALLAATTLAFGWMLLAGEGDGVARGGVVSFVLSNEVHPTLPPAVGSDGSIVFPDASEDGLLLLAPGTLTPVRLAGAEGALRAAFSPDARWLVFTQPLDRGGYAVRRMPSGGGPASTLWETRETFQPAWGALSWGDDGWIYVSVEDGIGRIPEEGGQLDTLFSVENAQLLPDLDALPEGRGLIFTLASGDAGPDNRTILMDLDSRDTTTIVGDGVGARWVSSGHIVYGHAAGALYALPFDPHRLEPTGSPVPVVDNAAVLSRVMGRFDVSPDGLLAYVEGATFAGDGGVFFALVSPEGEVERLRLEGTDHPDVGLSPDGRMIAYTRGDHIWIYDLDRGTNRQLTQEGTFHHNPIWAPDGTEIVFTSVREGGPTDGNLFVRRADGTGSARRIGGLPTVPDFAHQWLPDGTIIVDTGGPNEGDIYRISADGDAPPEALLEADWLEASGEVSPDGRWFAYVSEEVGGEPQLFLRRWPDLGGRTQLTSGEQGPVLGGAHGFAWAADSRTIYYMSDLDLRAVTLNGANAGDVEIRDTGVELPGPIWDVHPDGRLLVHTGFGGAGDDASPQRLVVVSNWITALRQRFGADR